MRVLAEPGGEERLGLVGDVVEDVAAVGRKVYAGEILTMSASRGPNDFYFLLPTSASLLDP